VTDSADATAGTALDEYPEWAEAIAAIVASGGTTMVVGGVDVGKSTFTRLLVNMAVDSGRRSAVLDADPGQSEIGPPACAGLAMASGQIHSLTELAPVALAFLGGISPAALIPEHITCVRRLADQAGDCFLVVDTSGYIHGPGARRLLQCEMEILLPRHVVALQRGAELETILSPARRRIGCTIHTPPIPACISVKTASFRAQRRAMRFAAYFRDSEIAHYSLSDVAFSGTWLGSGTPVAAHILRFLNETLGPVTRVYYAEQSGSHLGLMVNRLLSEGPEMGMALAQLKAKEVSVTLAPRLKHLLVGMEATNGKLLGLGLIESLDFRRGTIGLLTPVRSPEAACILRLGTQKIAPDGRDAGQLKAGEL